MFDFFFPDPNPSSFSSISLRLLSNDIQSSQFETQILIKQSVILKLECLAPKSYNMGVSVDEPTGQLFTLEMSLGMVTVMLV